MSSSKPSEQPSNEPPSDQREWRRVLAIDTATRVQALALLDGPTVLEHSQRRVRFNHGSSLLVHIAQMLEEHRLEVGDLDLIAVGVGPGSFTGLRVGLAIAKSLARAEQIPIVGVSSLAALAYPVAHSHPQALVCPMYDARRREVYAGAYRAGDAGLVQLEADQTIAPDAMRDKLAQWAAESPVVVVGDGHRKYDALGDVDAPQITWMSAWADAPSAAAIAALGRRKGARDGLDNVGSLEPNYIRPTDAELNHQ